MLISELNACFCSCFSAALNCYKNSQNLLTLQRQEGLN